MLGADDIYELSLLDLADRIRRGEITVEASTRSSLQRIAHCDPDLHSFLTVTAETAIRDSRRADFELRRGRWRGPLHGVPLAIKDNIQMEGYPTSNGMPLLRAAAAVADAKVVKRLRKAGAIIVGKTTMTDGALALHNPAFPRPVNPWDPSLWTGVSSSGSGVAVAARLCHAALGTDSGGSIRFPASANNLTGIKPTHGCVSCDGIIPLAPSLDCVGPLARDIHDAAAVLDAIAGSNGLDWLPIDSAKRRVNWDPHEITIGIDWDYATKGVDPSIVTALGSAIEVWAGVGARIREVRFPQIAEELAIADEVVPIEARTSHANALAAAGHRPLVGSTVSDTGAVVRTRTEVRAYQALAHVKDRVSALMGAVDTLLLPVLPRELPVWDEMQPPGAPTAAAVNALLPLLRYTQVINMAGLPSVAFPGGVGVNAAPIGLQLVAPAFGEALAIRAVAAFQELTDYHERRSRPRHGC